MTDRHTPGPWHYGRDRTGRKRVFDRDGSEVVRAMSEGIGLKRRSKEEREANALLIAAAPDMLRALRKVRLACDNLDDDVLYAVIAALDKAAGL